MNEGLTGMTAKQVLEFTKVYAERFGSLTPDSLENLSELLDKDIVFTDPFNRIDGSDEFIAVFEHMFEVMREPRFHILDLAASKGAGYIKWRMTGRLKKRPELGVNIVGMSEVVFNDDGMLIRHIDHWDSASQLLSQIPVAGWFVRKLMQIFTI